MAKIIKASDGETYTVKTDLGGGIYEATTSDGATKMIHIRKQITEENVAKSSAPVAKNAANNIAPIAPESGNLAPAKPESGQGLAVAAIILGILGIILIGACSWLAIIFGAITHKQTFANPRISGYAKAGFVLGIVGTAIWTILGTAAYLWASVWGENLVIDNLRQQSVTQAVAAVSQYKSDHAGDLPATKTDFLPYMVSNDYLYFVSYKPGVNCAGATDAKNFALTIKLSDGSDYCQDK